MRKRGNMWLRRSVLAGALVLFRRKFVLTDARAAEISAQLHGEEAHHD